MRIPGTLIFILFLSGHLYAQQLIFENVSVPLNLPSKECYNIMQDKRGDMWIATDAGLCKYDGNSIIVFDKKNGIPESSCYSVTEDEEGTIWIGTSAGRILYYKNNTLEEAPFMQPLQDSMKTENLFVYSIKPIDKKNLYFSTQRNGHLVDLYSGKIFTLGPADSTSDFIFEKMGRQLLCYKRRPMPREELLKNAIKGFLEFDLRHVGVLDKIKILSTQGVIPDWRMLTAIDRKGNLYIAYYNTLIRIDTNNQYQIYPLANRAIALYCDKTDGIWVGTYKCGAYYYPDLSHSGNFMKILPEYSVTGICEDRENGIWCSTLEKGIFYSRNKNVISYKNIEGLEIKAEMLKTLNKKILVSSAPNYIFELTENEWTKKEIKNERNSIIRDITNINHINFTVGREFIEYTDQSGHRSTVKLQNSTLLSGAIQLIEGPDDRVFIINASRDLKEIVNGKVSDQFLVTQGIGTYLFHDTIKHELLYGTKTGAYIVDTKNWELKKVAGVEGTVLKILMLSGGDLCYLTKESGIYVQHNDKVERIDEKYKFPISVFHDIIEDDDHNIWIGSNQGLIKITPFPFSSVRIYTVLNGLPSNVVYSITVNDPYIYLSTDEGIIRFPRKYELANQTPPLVSLNEFKINGVKANYLANSVFSYQNSIEVTLYIPSYKNPGHTVFQYELLGSEYKTGLVEGNKLLLDKLAPGNHTLIIYSLNNDGIKSQVPLILSFTISRPFWSSAWFIISATIGWIIIVYFIIKIMTRTIRSREQKKTEINRQLSEYRLTALQAQMNPHFIFNAINSIQHYILSNETQSAYDYLAKFSKLIRLVLSNSQHSVISLKKELESLELYIELEQKRFKNKFNYYIQVDEQLDIDEIKIPVMLVQPFVENAIWHGIMNLDESKKGTLYIYVVYSDQNSVKIIVKDNGVGRKKAMELRSSSDHTSMGTLLSESRLNLLKEITHKDQKIVITDLFDENGIAMGTKVEIILPYE